MQDKTEGRLGWCILIQTLILLRQSGDSVYKIVFLSKENSLTTMAVKNYVRKHGNFHILYINSWYVIIRGALLIK